MLPSLCLQNLQLRDFRSYALLRLGVVPGLNVFCGPNGAGKTNLLEAAAYLALGRSPRTTRDADLIRTGREGFEIRADYWISAAAQPGGPTSSVAVRYRPQLGRAAEIDGLPAPALSALYGRLTAVFFSPDDLWLLKAGPATRRALLDRLLVQASPLYADASQRYRQAVAQRNATLQDVRARRAGRALLAIWEPQLVQYGGEIMRRRAEAVLRLAPLAADAYTELAGPGEVLDWRYVPGLGPQGARGTQPADLASWPDRLQAALASQQDADLAAGATTVGPHRDDLEATIAGRLAQRFASQGQQRSAVLAMKFAERALLAEQTGHRPLLLVDDVLSELDERRRGALYQLLAREGQVFLTTADEQQALALPAAARFAVGAEGVRRAASSV